MAEVTKTRGSTRNISYYRGGSSRTVFQTARPPKLQRPSGTSGLVTRSDLETMSGFTTRGYFKTVRESGTLPVNPYSSTRHAFEAGSSIAIYRCLRRPSTNEWAERWYVATDFPASQPLAVSGSPSLPEAPVLTQAIANLRGDLWDIGTTAAEFGKTVKLVVAAGASIRRAQDFILKVMGARKRGRRLSAREFMDEFSRLWLEGRYGWRPLYYDLLAAQEAYERLGKGLVVRRGAARASKSLVSSGVHASALPGSFGDVARINRRTTFTVSVRGFCGGYLDLDKPVSIDPLVTGWEVIPYSFVIDWFFNIGSNIQAYSPLAAGKLLWSGTSTVVQSETVLSIELNPAPSGWQVVEQSIEGSGTFRCSRRDTTRVPAQGVVSLEFKPRLDILKGIDLIALASNLASNVTRRANRMGR